MTLILVAIGGFIVGGTVGVIIGCCLGTASAQDDMQRKEMFQKATEEWEKKKKK